MLASNLTLLLSGAGGFGISGQFFLNGALITNLSGPLALAAGANTITGTGTGTLLGVIQDAVQSTIPIMGSNSGTALTGGALTLFASSEFNSTYAAWKACDGSSTTDFATNGAGDNWWILAFYATPIVPRSITLRGRWGSQTEYPNAGVVEGSNDNVNWTTLIASVPPLPYSSGDQTLQIVTSTAYSYVRYRSTQKNQAATQNNIGLSTFQIAAQLSSSLTYALDAGATLTLSGTNTYTGTTTINSGTIKVSSASALSAGTVAVNGGTLDLSALTYAQRDIILASATNGGGNITPLQGEYLLIGGGGGGANTGGAGGGGAGGVIYNSAFIFNAQSYDIAVGNGGAPLAKGGNTTAFGEMALGGGNGGQAGALGAVGGSSGGGSYFVSSPNGIQTSVNGGTAYANKGGFGNGGTTSNTAGGGGGGAGGAGSNCGVVTSGSGGAGGIGIELSITGAATWYAGGGGGGAENRTGGHAGGAGGSGIGGNGTAASTGSAGNGVDNTGSGGGGGSNGSTTGGKGGSGVVVVAYRAAYGSSKAIMTGVASDSPTRSGWIVRRATADAGNLVVV